MNSDQHPLAPREPKSLIQAAKRPGVIAALLGMLALDWAALDDLTTDPGTSLFLEGLIVLVSVPVIATLIRNIWPPKSER